MFWKLNALALISFVALAMGLIGCGQHASSPAPGPQTPAATAAPAQESPGPAIGESKAHAKSTLTEADRKLIAQQKVCPVSGEELGAMGDPVKVVVKGRTVFLCCDGCEEALRADPDKYLKKLDQKK